MSTISKLEIRGIRSFGTDLEDAQTLNFRSPLTLIVGQNGCGKTTIIECLKYGLTGDFPPGTNRGIGFVHDPKIFGNVESLGQVKLTVKDVTGNSVTAIRSMKMTQKGSTSKHETLDSTITMENAQKNTKITMIRSKAADINNDMCDAMGVSKAILDNVIFCHQEASNWPLEEPKELKKRFDAIFGTTEYHMGIEKLIKIGKSYNDRQKEKLGDLKLLQHIKEQAEGKQLQLDDGEKKLSNLRQTISDLKSELEPILKKLEQLALVEREYSSLMAKRIEYTSKIKGKHLQQKQLQSKISQLFEGSLVELDAEIRNFKQTSTSMRAKLQVEESSLQSTRSQGKSLKGKLQSLERQSRDLLAQQKREGELQTDRGKKITALGGKLKLRLLDDYSSVSSDASVIDVALRSIRDALKAEETSVEAMGKSFEEEDVRAQKTIDKLRETKASLESECQSKRRQTEQMKREKQRTASDLAKIERSAEALMRLMDETAKLELEYEVHAKATNIPAMKKELSEKKELHDQLQDQLDRLDERVTALNEFAVKERQLTLKEQQCSGRELQLRRLRSKHADSLRRLFPDRTIESNYKRNMQDLYDTLQKEVKTKNDKIRQTQATVTEMETTRKNQKQQLERLERDMAEAEEKINAGCRGNAYVDVLAKLNDKINKNNLEHGEARSTVVLYQKFISNIENDRCCPVCEKGMGGEDAQHVCGKLTDEMLRLPEKIKSLESTLKKDRLEYDRLLALKPISEQLDKQKMELPRLKQQLQDTERRLTTASDDLEEHQVAVSEPTRNLQLISSIVGDMSVLDESSKELERMRRGMDELKTELANKVPEGVTIESLKAKRGALREKLQSERRSVDELQSSIHAKTEKLNNLQSRNNQLKAKKLKLQESIQPLELMRTKIRELEVQIGTLDGELQAVEERLQPLKEQLASAVGQKKRSKDANMQKLQNARKVLEGLNWEETEIIRLGCDLEQLAALNLSTELNGLQIKMDQLMVERDRITTSIAPKTKLIEKLKQDIANQQLRERDLHDNRDLKRLMRETSVLESDLEELMKGIGEMEIENVDKERTRLLDIRDGLQGKRSELNGQKSQLKFQLSVLRQELNRSEYQNALRNYNKTLYESVVLRKMGSDIKKYREALEWSVRKFHTEKMKFINQSIYSLWRNIYRGNDIDYIRINTEDEEEAGGSKRRRVYSYRVVQSKNDVEIDMRGRCSAGQKVLASLIIRLALAEAFCDKCGVMALDEPTTNLDRNNIHSLCESLRDLVAERQCANFMLIVITHDEEFVTELEKFETYFRISRNHDGKSVIREEKL